MWNALLRTKQRSKIRGFKQLHIAKFRCEWKKTRDNIGCGEGGKDQRNEQSGCRSPKLSVNKKSKKSGAGRI